MTDSSLQPHAFVPARTPIDLTNCDREPIHIPGAIQPHGVLLGVRQSDRCVLQSSANAAARLGRDRIDGRPLDEVIGAAAAEATFAAVARGHARTGTTVSTPAGDFDATVHVSDGLLVLELESPGDAPPFTPEGFREVIRETLGHIEQATTLKGLASEIAAQMRRLTGFDRIWVYRFHEDWHGEIIGESMRDGIEPWLGLHYPASDIPAQARALFLKNWLRMIPDVGFVPVPLEPVDNPLTHAPLDLGNSVLRSVSPIHIEYLTNMGVTASLVISLIHRGQLWGLISGHHYSGPKHVPLATRTVCEFLAQALSLQVGMAERVEDRERALEVRTVESRLRERLANAEGYQRALTQGSPSLLDLTRATGAALCDDGGCACVGRTPTKPELTALVGWLREQGRDVFQTEMLSRHYPPAAAWTSFASGLLAIALSAKRPHYLLWFRPELTQTIRWAGDPNKPVTESEPGSAPRLSPRGSFALWEEERRGSAEPWEPIAIEAATDLRRTLLDLLLGKAEEVAQMNVELEVANQTLSETAVELETQAEELMQQREELMQQREEREALLGRERAARSEAERANQAKSEFLAMMSHELRTPLNAIGGYAQMMEDGVRGPVNAEQIVDLKRIQHNQRHLLGLINNILNFAKVEAGQVPIHPEPFEVDALVAEIESLVLPQLTAKKLSFKVAREANGARAYADPEKVRQIILNLVSNAIKFTGPGGSIALAVHREHERICISVTDTGAGIPRASLRSIFEPFVQVDPYAAGKRHDGIGLGLAISRELARSMHGDVTVVSEEHKGSTFSLTLPEAR